MDAKEVNSMMWNVSRKLHLSYKILGAYKDAVTALQTLDSKEVDNILTTLDAKIEDVKTTMREEEVARERAYLEARNANPLWHTACAIAKEKGLEPDAIYSYLCRLERLAKE